MSQLWLLLYYLFLVQTPERIEFSNMSGGVSDHEESFSQMDEDEWTDRNFGASAAELGSSDDDSSSDSRFIIYFLTKIIIHDFLLISRKCLLFINRHTVHCTLTTNQ